MTPFVRSRPQQRAATVVFVLVGGIGFLPLFGGPGYEHALASGLIVPSAAAIVTALELVDWQSQSPQRQGASPLACWGRGVLSGLALAGVAFLTALLHALRVGLCDLQGGALGFLLTAGLGAPLGGVWGAIVAELLRRRKHTRRGVALLAVSLPVACIVVSVWRFYASPMIFAFDPFFGFFSGTLYDTVVDAGAPLFSYRAGTLCTLTGGALVASVLARDDLGRLRLVPFRRDVAARVRTIVGASLLAASLAVTVLGATLGHWQSSATIAADLGGFLRGARCDVVYPDTMRPDEAQLLAKDCDEELASVEAVLGARGPERVRAFFFRDAGDKKRLMGAGDTYIAKPWRGEVYLQVAAYPHPVLGHELAHVVAGSFGRGPFKIAGKLGGYWPNPGLIEGVAVAASPDDDELMDLEWVHALAELGTLPPLASVFSFDFFTSPAAKSYTVAGAFVRWLLDRFGAATVRAWYGGMSLPALTHESWPALETEFRAAAAETTISVEAQSYAKAKFEHAAIFGRKCPHVVDGLRQKADRCRDAHQIDKAMALYDEVLAKDSHDWAARYGRGYAQLRWGDAGRGQGELRAIEADKDAPRTYKDRTSDALADFDLLSGRIEEATGRYDVLANKTLDEDFGRTLEVKSREASDDRGRGAVVALLLGARGKPNDLVLAAERLGEWYDQTHDPVAAYLIGRNLAQRGWLAESAVFFDASLAADAPTTARIGRETIRQRAIVACALGDAATVKRLVTRTTDPAGPYARSTGRRESVLRLLGRCETTQAP